MPPISIDDLVVHHRDAEMLARAARLPFAAIGSVSPERPATIRMRLGAGRPCRGPAPPSPAGVVAHLVGRIASASELVPEAAEGDRTGSGIRIERVEGSSRSLAWLSSERGLVAAWYPLAGAMPFVALIRDGAGGPFPRWHRELARLALMQETERLRGEARAPAANQPTNPATWEGGILESVLNRLTIPIAVVERTGRVVYCNRAARAGFGSCGALGLADGRVASPHADTDRRLHLAIRAVTNGINRRSHVLLLPDDPASGPRPDNPAAGPRPDGPSQRALVVTPVAAPRGLALLVCAHGAQDGPMLNMMLSELGLTPTERRLTTRLIGGDRLEDAARQINVKVSTARSYLRNIFDKTGASRQSQLVSLAMSLTPPASLAEAPPRQRAIPLLGPMGGPSRMVPDMALGAVLGEAPAAFPGTARVMTRAASSGVPPRRTRPEACGPRARTS